MHTDVCLGDKLQWCSITSVFAENKGKNEKAR